MKYTVPLINADNANSSNISHVCRKILLEQHEKGMFIQCLSLARLILAAMKELFLKCDCSCLCNLFKKLFASDPGIFY